MRKDYQDTAHRWCSARCKVIGVYSHPPSCRNAIMLWDLVIQMFHQRTCFGPSSGWPHQPSGCCQEILDERFAQWEAKACPAWPSSQQCQACRKGAASPSTKTEKSCRSRCQVQILPASSPVQIHQVSGACSNQMCCLDWVFMKPQSSIIRFSGTWRSGSWVSETWCGMQRLSRRAIWKCPVKGRRIRRGEEHGLFWPHAKGLHWLTVYHTFRESDMMFFNRFCQTWCYLFQWRWMFAVSREWMNTTNLVWHANSAIVW